MGRYLFLLLMALSSGVSGSPSLTWHDGVVVLSDQQILNGQVAIHKRENLILFRLGEKVTVYPAHKIQNVFYYDHNADINRKFVSIANHEHGYAEYQLFEIVLRGQVTVLRKERFHLNHEDHEDFNYFTLYRDEVLPIKQFRKKVYPHLSDCDPIKSSAYEGKERLNLNSTKDAINLIKFYNQLVRNSESLARS